MGVCTRDGLDARLTLVGDGKYRSEFEAQVEKEGLQERIHFAGYLTSGAAIRERLDEADIFVLPSFQEGLPRAMIEAMARGLPCLGTDVGGTSELLPAEDLLTPGDVDGMARKIGELAADTARMTRAAARNFDKAREYQDETLRQRRTAFYQYVRARTEAWLRPQAVAWSSPADS